MKVAAQQALNGRCESKDVHVQQILGKFVNRNDKKKRMKLKQEAIAVRNTLKSLWLTLQQIGFLGRHSQTLPDYWFKGKQSPLIRIGRQHERNQCRSTPM